jgi:hypothetical protein
MWLFTKEGFVSVVSNREGDGLVVRARDKRALDGISESGGVPIAKSPKSDYPYRVFVSKQEFRSWISSEVSDLNYTNFKSKVGQTRGSQYSNALHEVWATMHHVEDSDARSGLRFGYIKRPLDGPRRGLDV